ncbi:MAG: DNA primase [Terrimicrobiaceae bacterium]
MPRISEETIRRVAEATDIVDLVSSYFPLKRAGASWRATCPFHNEKTPSFHVTPARQSFHCFGCGAGGGVYRFVMDYEHLPFAEAVRRLAAKAGIPVIEEAGNSDDDRKENLRRRLLAIHALAAQWFHQNLMKSPEAEAARHYLKGRAIGAPVAKDWQIGFAPDSWDALPNLLREHKFTNQEILQSGLVSSSDGEESQEAGTARVYARFRGRVMFPIHNDYGEVIAFSGRVLEADAKAAKYVNSPETPLFSKGRVLYGLNHSKRALIEAKEAIVCEGQLDTISAFEAGVKNVIAPQGTAFTHDQARLLARFVETVVLCFDSDKAGQEATSRSLPALLECGLSVRVARLPEGSDPDSMIRSDGPEAFRELVAKAKDFFDHAIERTIESGALADPAKVAAASRKLGSLLSAVKDPVLRDSVIGRICAQLGLSPKAFRDQMKQVKPPRQDFGSSADGPQSPQVEQIDLSAGLEMLCRLAIHSPGARDWLAAKNDPPPLALGPGGVLLQRILEHPVPLDSVGAVASFSASLPLELERVFARLDPPRSIDNILEACQLNWEGLVAGLLKQQQEILKAKLRQANLPSDHALKINKEILDLSRRLNDLSRPVA